MAARNGSEFIDGLRRNPREVWIAGRRIDQVADDPVFARPVRAIASLYDLQTSLEHRDVMTHRDGDGSEPYGTSFLTPRSQADLIKRRQSMTVWAEATFGMLGRSPHSLLEGLAMYEEDGYLRTLGVHLTLGSIAHLYANGSFPSITVWRTRVTDWGLRNPTAVDLCYEDGQAMSAVIMQRHGGAAGIAGVFQRAAAAGAGPVGLGVARQRQVHPGDVVAGVVGARGSNGCRDARGSAAEHGDFIFAIERYLARRFGDGFGGQGDIPGWCAGDNAPDGGF